MVDKDHIPHEKHLQLGVQIGEDGVPIGDDRTFLPEDKHDDVWAKATTVEQFKEDIELLAREAGKT